MSFLFAVVFLGMDTLRSAMPARERVAVRATFRHRRRQ